jgi:hypothetical protein
LIQHFDFEQKEWVEIPVPGEITKRYPPIDDPVQRDWNQLVKEFVEDIRGEGSQGYPTFRDGWLANEVMEIIRSEQEWRRVRAYNHKTSKLRST